jgi:hypothetical protein
MLVTRRSSISNLEHTLEINITLEQIQAWQNGKETLEDMLHLTEDERKFLLTGCIKEEININFKKE